MHRKFSPFTLRFFRIRAARFVPILCRFVAYFATILCRLKLMIGCFYIY